jgi:hypothetical protein
VIEMRTYNLVFGILLVASGVAMIGGAVFVPIAAMGLVAGGLACIGSGAFCIWLAQITKGTIIDRPLGYGLTTGMAQMNAGMAASNAMLSSMVATNAGATGTAYPNATYQGSGTTFVAAPGVPARARVDLIVDQGSAVDVHLTVSRRGMDPYAVVVRRPLSPVARAQLHPGADIAVTVDPLDPAEVNLAIAN